MTVIEEIATERRRQVESEGWTPEHDNEHTERELARAAACYAADSLLVMTAPECSERGWTVPRRLWPWGLHCWRPGSDRRRQLVKAGALIVAEIERLDRLSRDSDCTATAAANGDLPVPQDCQALCEAIAQPHPKAGQHD